MSFRSTFGVQSSFQCYFVKKLIVGIPILVGTFGFAAQSTYAQSSDGCELSLGEMTASNGRIKAKVRVKVQLTCGDENYDIGMADGAEMATYSKKGDRLILVTDFGRQRLVIFRKNPAKTSEGTKKFGEFEVEERVAIRAVVSMKAFEERGAIVIWRRGGP